MLEGRGVGVVEEVVVAEECLVGVGLIAGTVTSEGEIVQQLLVLGVGAGETPF